MTIRVERIEGSAMPVNSFLVHGPDGVIVVDGMLTVSDAALVRKAIDDSGRSLAGVVVTHPHPDHYAGLGHLVGPDDVPIVATIAVDEVIRRDDQLKHEIVGPMMGDEWPATRIFPNQTVNDSDEVRLGGLTLSVQELGPGESHVDSMWRLDASTVFAGDIAYNGMHAYLADGRWQDWLRTLSRLEAELPDDVTLHVGHGPIGREEPPRRTAPLHHHVRRGRRDERRRHRPRGPPRRHRDHADRPAERLAAVLDGSQHRARSRRARRAA